MILSRELGKRIWGGSTNMENGGGGVSSDYIAGLLAGYATESWVDEHYISIDFFSRLFQAHGTENGSEIDVMPNDMETTITSVESMFGFWTNLYISALGSNGAAPAGISLGMLTDVNISGTPSAGQVLTFDATTQKWVNGNAQAGATALANLTDVTLSQVQNGQTLLYDSTTSKWYNSALKTINGQSLLGSGDISVGGGASGNYLPLTGGTMVGATYYGGSFAHGANTGVARMGRFDHANGAVLQLGSGGMFEIINSGWTIANFTVRDNSMVKIGNGSDILDDYGNIMFPFTVTTSLQYSDTGWHSLFSDTNKRGILFGVRSGKAAIGVIGSSSLLIEPDVGIGIANPECKLHVNGSFKSSSASQFANVRIGAASLNMSDANACIELLTGTGYIDWHFQGSSADRTSRIIEVSSGTLTFDSTSINVQGSIYATGAVTALSDARKKDITGEAGVTVEQIAHAPAVQFLWKDAERRKDGQQVGTLAQYWQTVLPEVVSDKGGELSMQYGVTALVSAIITARKVVDHERRIAELEKENDRLKEEISQLRLN